MNNAHTTFQFGVATVRTFTLGSLVVNLAEWLRLPAAQWPPRYAADLAQPISVPVQCIHIALPGMALLIDACDAAGIAHTSFASPGYQPPPELPMQMQASSLAPESVQHVVITHAHFDHFSGLAREHDGHRVLCFPNARHYLGQADWHALRGNLSQPDSLERRTLGVVQEHGLLALVEQQHEISAGVTIIPAPGESPGHQIVRVHSQGQTLYCLGDLYHHAIEVEHPALMVHWADAATNQRSRAMLVDAALAEDALLIAAHIDGVGRLRRTATGVVWETAIAAVAGRD